MEEIKTKPDVTPEEEIDEPGIGDHLTGLTDHVTDLLDSYYKLAAVTATEKATNIGSGMLAGVVTLVLGLFFILFAGFALAWWLGDVFESRALGFLTVAAVFAITTVVIIALRKKIVFPYFRNMILRRFYV